MRTREVSMCLIEFSDPRRGRPRIRRNASKHSNPRGTGALTLKLSRQNMKIGTIVSMVLANGTLVSGRSRFGENHSAATVPCLDGKCNGS